MAKNFDQKKVSNDNKPPIRETEYELTSFLPIILFAALLVIAGTIYAILQ